MKDLAITFTGGKFNSLVIDGHRIDGVTSLMLSVPTPGSIPTLTVMITGKPAVRNSEKPTNAGMTISVTKDGKPEQSNDNDNNYQ